MNKEHLIVSKNDVKKVEDNIGNIAWELFQTLKNNGLVKNN